MGWDGAPLCGGRREKTPGMGGIQPNGVARHGLVQLGEEKVPERPRCGLPVLEVSV